MDILFIFAIGWVMSHAFSEKRDEYSAAQEGNREKYLAKLTNDHPSWGHARRERYLQNAARRNALGHFAYLLRHGWSSTFNDFHHGWKKAKAAHEEWKNEHPKGEKKPGWWATFKAGWKDSLARRPKATGYYEARPELTPETPDPEPAKGHPQPKQPEPATDPWLTDEEARDAKVYPWPNETADTQPSGDPAGTTNGSTPVEAPNLDAARAALNVKAAAYRTDASGNEQLTADMIAGGMDADQDTMNHIAAMNEALATAAAHAEAANAGLGKHQSGQEYANSGHAAKTDSLKST